MYRSLPLLTLALALAACGPETTPITGLEDGAFLDQYPTSHEEEIALGGAAREEMTGTFEAHNWVFEGSAGETVQIEVLGDGLSDPRFRLYGPDLQIVAEADDSEGSVNAEAEVTLPRTGRYIIRVDMWAPGTYTIRLKPGG
jgi:hypothetical protein